MLAGDDGHGPGPGRSTHILGLDRAAYAFAGGAFPIRVNGALVGTVGVSGLTDVEDHDLVVEALEELTSAESL